VGFWIATFGVVVFFGISGFLLYRPFVAARERGSSVAEISPAYLWRRVVRIFPAYWVAITVLAVWPGLTGVFSDHWWVQYGLLKVYSTAWDASGLDTAWSLCIEVSFYLALPLIAALLARRGLGSGRSGALAWEVGVLGGLGALSLIWRGEMGPNPATSHLTFNLLGTFTWFSAGMLLAVAEMAPTNAWVRTRWALGRPELCWTTAAVLFALLPLGAFRGLGLSNEMGIVVETLVMVVAAGLLLSPAMLGDSGRIVTWAMASRWPVFLGTISYGMYLWHFPIVEWLLEPGRLTWSPAPIVTVAAFAFLASVALGSASWFLVEKPLMLRARSVKAFSHVGHRTVEPSPARSGPELADGEDREGMGPGERGRGAGSTGASVDALGEQSPGGDGTAQGGHEPQGDSTLA
jgi:peptidoglycan/LPS O-acetylase OafA/YrhL